MTDGRLARESVEVVVNTDAPAIQLARESAEALVNNTPDPSVWLFRESVEVLVSGKITRSVVGLSGEGTVTATGEPYEPPPPPPPVVIKSAGCVLGCGDTRVLLMDRCGSSIIEDITLQVASGSYGRVLDDTSDASATVATKGDTASKSCNAALGSLRTWRNTIAYMRDGELTWFGPLTGIMYRRDTVVLSARDISAWLDRRVIHNNYNFVNRLATDIAQILIEDALGVEDPCGLAANVIITGTSTKRLDKKVVAHDGYAGDVIREMAESVIDVTVLGTTFIISDKLEFGPFTRLTDEDFQVELEVEERGVDAGTKWYTKGSAVEGTAGGTDPYYGLIEQVANDDTLLTAASATVASTTRLTTSNPPPLYVNIPDGARLSPQAPICFEQLVPGAMIDVMLRDYVRPVASRNILTAVKVDLSGSDEAVGVSLAPRSI